RPRRAFRERETTAEPRGKTRSSSHCPGASFHHPVIMRLHTAWTAAAARWCTIVESARPTSRAWPRRASESRPRGGHALRGHRRCAPHRSKSSHRRLDRRSDLADVAALGDAGADAWRVTADRLAPDAVTQERSLRFVLAAFRPFRDQGRYR